MDYSMEDLSNISYWLKWLLNNHPELFEENREEIRRLISKSEGMLPECGRD